MALALNCQSVSKGVTASSIVSAKHIDTDGVTPIDKTDHRRLKPPKKTIAPNSMKRPRRRSIPGTADT